jgi:hypothetical protein
MIGILITSAFISVLALGLEMMVKADKEEKAANAKKEEDKERREKGAMAAEEKRQDRRDAAVRHQEALLKQIQADAKEQDRFLGQRFVILDLAAKQQRRDSEMSMQIAREANIRLSEAERTLAELERVNNPLRRIDAQVSLELNLDGLDLSGFWERMTRKRDQTPYRTPQRDYVGLQQDDPVDGRIRERANRMSINLDFVPSDEAPGAPAVKSGAEIRPVQSERNGGGDFALSDLIQLPVLRLETVVAHVPSRSVIAHFVSTRTLEPEGMVKGGLKISISEALKLIPMLSVQQGYLEERRGGVTNRLMGASISLNGLERFRAESALGFAGKSSFMLHMSTPRR